MLRRQDEVVAGALNDGLRWPGVCAQDGLDIVDPLVNQVGTDSVADVLNAVALALTGEAARQDRPVNAAMELGSWTRVCVVLVDGLGYHNLAARIGHAPTLRSGMNDLPVLSAPYPSTTSASIGAFGTSASPGQTGMLGYTVRNPEDGRLGNLVQWTGLPAPTDWQREPTVFEVLTRRGVQVTSIGPARFADSGMTNASLRGGDYLASESWSDRIRQAARVLREPGLAYVYWGDLDKAGHHYGWQSNQWCAELEKVDAGLRRLLTEIPSGTLVLMLADHGMIDVDLSQRWDVAQSAPLSQDVSLIAGEPRALHVHLNPGSDLAAAHARWSMELGDQAVVLAREVAIDAGLFGPVATANVDRIGDLVVAMKGRATVVDSKTQSPASMALVGVHGSLTQWEMDVPLLNWHR